MTKKNLNLTFDELYDKVKEYIKDQNDLNLIKKAYDYAEEKHYGVFRLTGEPYIEHPLNVAYILTSVNADAATICAGLLHDVLEDCDVSKEQMEDEFGNEITSLVDGVTKINKLNFQAANEVMIANHRKILVGLSEDVRVIIIKLADRLHNMRTLWIQPEAKQKAKAKETLDILTPIAHRLGMSHIKGELEDLSLRYYKPDIYFSIVEQLNQTKSERDNIVEEMMNNVSKILTDHGIKHEIKGRAKRIYSIYKKLDKGKKFKDIYDLLALRVFVNTEEECYQALGYIHAKYRPLPKRFKDYIAMPKTNMYQSLHTTVFGDNENLFEIQIRTYEMDQVAEKGIAAHWSYKEQGSNNKASMQNAMEQKLQFFRSIIELQNEDINDETFVNSVKEEVFRDNVYVFTPKGDVIELTKGSTPIDFAYRVHTSVGEHMIGAIVNGNIVPLDYELKDNDVIRINTNKNSEGPSREWIKMAKTSQARNKIRGFFNKIDKEGYLKNGQEDFNKELKKRKISTSEFLTHENIDKILKELKYSNINEMYINIGNNKLTPTQIINIISDNNETKEELILKKVQNHEIDKVVVNKNDIIVEGIDDIKVNVASCCKPIPGDLIVGYITKGYGITIHRCACPNVSELNERIIDVKWNNATEKKYQATIMVYANKSDNVLLDIVSKTSNSDIVVLSMNTIRSKDQYMFEVTLQIKNLESLNKFINDVNIIPDVMDVERIIK